MPERNQQSGSANRSKYGYAQPSGAQLRKKYGYPKYPTKKSKQGERTRRYWRQRRDFLGVDGEAVDDRYVLLACSDGSYIENKAGLRTTDCLKFLVSRRTKTLWGFSFDYDVNMILGGATPTQLQYLVSSNRCYIERYRIEHIPGKMFRVKDTESGEYVTLWDAFGYIHTSFAAWVKDWKLGSVKDLRFIERMKDRRPDFTLRQLPQIRRYCFAELRLLHQGVEELVDRIRQVGYRPAAWHSPGSIAAAAMRQHKVKDGLAELPSRIEQAASDAYFGGRFETRALGFIKGPLWHYDINSAYPSALVNLPCLSCGSWKRRRKGSPSDINLPHALLYIEWRPRSPVRDPKRRQAWGPFPVRVDAGSLRYPLIGEGWYWSFEAAAARPLAKVTVRHAIEYRADCEHRPFEYLSSLYTQRQELKAAQDGAEYVLKLILNSTYGKLAQHPRHGRTPPFRSPVWAGMITARCRAQLLDAIGQDPEAIIQTATDGLTSWRELDLPLSDRLGGWSVSQLNRLLLMQSGVYFWQDAGNKPYQRSRGFHPRAMTQQACYNAWKRSDRFIDFPNRRFVGYRSAMHRGALDKWRTWEDYTARLQLTPEPRRETLEHKDGYVLSAPPVRAQADLADLLLDPTWWDDAGWELEQPDGPEGGSL